MVASWRLSRTIYATQNNRMQLREGPRRVRLRFFLPRCVPDSRRPGFRLERLLWPELVTRMLRNLVEKCTFKSIQGNCKTFTKTLRFMVLIPEFDISLIVWRRLPRQFEFFLFLGISVRQGILIKHIDYFRFDGKVRKNQNKTTDCPEKQSIDRAS